MKKITFTQSDAMKESVKLLPRPRPALIQIHCYCLLFLVSLMCLHLVLVFPAVDCVIEKSVLLSSSSSSVAQQPLATTTIKPKIVPKAASGNAQTEAKEVALAQAQTASVAATAFEQKTTKPAKRSGKVESLNPDSTMPRIARLSGERAQFECNLSPLASADNYDASSPSSNHSSGRGHQLGKRSEGVAAETDKEGEEAHGPLRIGKERRARHSAANATAMDASRQNPEQGDVCDQGTGGGALVRPRKIDEATARADAVPAQSAPKAATKTRGPRRRESQMDFVRPADGVDDDEEYSSSRSESQQHFLEDDEAVELILWYHISDSSSERQQQQLPIYSVDARQQALSAATPSAAVDQMGAAAGNSLVPVPVDHWPGSVGARKGDANLASARPTARSSSSSSSDSSSNLQGDLETEANQEEDNEQLNSINLPAKAAFASSANNDDDQSNYNRNNRNYDNSTTDDRGSKFVLNVISRNSKHYALAKLSSRIRFKFRGAKAYLIIDKLEPDDAGQYKCRVDFKYARTRYQSAKLEVITPVSQVQIKTIVDEQGIDLWSLQSPAATTNKTFLLASSPRPTKSQSSKVSGKGSVDGLKHQANNPAEQPAASPFILGFLEANEDEPFQFECQAKDGWPSSQVAWWRVDWPSQAARAGLSNDEDGGAQKLRVTQLSSAPSEALAILTSTVANATTIQVSANKQKQTAKEQQPTTNVVASSAANPMLLGAHLINAPANRGALASASAANDFDDREAGNVEKQTNKSERQTPTANANVASQSRGRLETHVASIGSSAYSNSETFTAAARFAALLNLTTNDEQTDDGWLAWMADELRARLAQLGQRSSEAALEASRRTSSSGPLTVSSDSFFLAELNALLQTQREHRLDGERLATNDGPASSSSGEEINANSMLAINTFPLSAPTLSGNRDAIWQFWRQNQLVLYTCGASNARSAANKLLAAANKNSSQQQGSQTGLAQSPVGADFPERRDKLANIRPVFSAILVRPNVRPRWIQMFLVGRRSARKTAATAQEESAENNNNQDDENLLAEQIELTLLDPNESLHLSLQAPVRPQELGGQLQQPEPSRPQLQLACVVGGAQPEATQLRWTRHNANQQQEEDDGAIVSANQRGRVRKQGKGGTVLVSDAQQETQALLRAFESSVGAKLPLPLADPKQRGRLQWSSLKVRSIGIGEHQAVIRCSAFNEKFRLRRKSIAKLAAATSKHGIDSEEDEEEEDELSTSVRLNITHVPFVKLALEWPTTEATAAAEVTTSDNAANSSLDKGSFGVGQNLRNVSELIVGDHDGHYDAERRTAAATATSDELDADKAETGLPLLLHRTTSSGGLQIKPIVYGENVTLACELAFANPGLVEPIEWSLNNTRLFDDGQVVGNNFAGLVQIVGKIETSNRYYFIERLIVRFADRSQSLLSASGAGHAAAAGSGGAASTSVELIELKCSARNALGKASSAPVRLLFGNAPRCLSGSSAASFQNSSSDTWNDSDSMRDSQAVASEKAASDNQRDDLSDKDSGSQKQQQQEQPKTTETAVAAAESETVTEAGLHCPVISDKSSSTYYWLVVVDNSQTTTAATSETRPATATTITTTMVSSGHSALIPLSKLNLPHGRKPSAYLAAGSASESSGEPKITCYARDKFGSNEKSPCLARRAPSQQLAAAAGRQGSNAFEQTATTRDNNSNKADNNNKNDGEEQFAASRSRVSQSQQQQQHNCAANLIRASTSSLLSSQKRRQSIKVATAAGETTGPFAASNQTTSADSTLKPRLLLAIECKEDQFKRSSSSSLSLDGNGDAGDSLTDTNDNNSSSSSSRDSRRRKDDERLVHFDLYTKRDAQFVRHLNTYSKEGGDSNLSVMLDLGDELSESSIGSTSSSSSGTIVADNNSLEGEGFESRHIVVMSVTDANNRPKQPNVTLHLRLIDSENSKLNGRLQQSADRFPRTSNSGHRDRLWVISSLSVVFGSSFVLVIIAWLCKGQGNKGSLRGNNNGSSNGSDSASTTTTNSDFNNNNTAANRQAGRRLTRFATGDSGKDTATLAGLSCRPTATTTGDKQQTEMYLVGGAGSRPAVFHNHQLMQYSCSQQQYQQYERQQQSATTTTAMATNLADQAEQQHQSQKALLLAQPGGLNGLSQCDRHGAGEPYDFLIIDPAPHQSAGAELLNSEQLVDGPSCLQAAATTSCLRFKEQRLQQQQQQQHHHQAILLIESEPHACATFNNLDHQHHYHPEYQDYQQQQDEQQQQLSTVADYSNPMLDPVVGLVQSNCGDEGGHTDDSSHHYHIHQGSSLDFRFQSQLMQSQPIVAATATVGGSPSSSSSAAILRTCYLGNGDSSSSSSSSNNNNNNNNNHQLAADSSSASIVTTTGRQQPNSAATTTSRHFNRRCNLEYGSTSSSRLQAQHQFTIDGPSSNNNSSAGVCRSSQRALIRSSPIGFVTTASSSPSGHNGNGFELNSQGELTITDESSSFIHEEGCDDCRLVGGGGVFAASSSSSTTTTATTTQATATQSPPITSIIVGGVSKRPHHQQHRPHNHRAPANYQVATATIKRRAGGGTTIRGGERGVRFVDYMNNFEFEDEQAANERRCE